MRTHGIIVKCTTYKKNICTKARLKCTINVQDILRQHLQLVGRKSILLVVRSDVVMFLS